MKFQQQSEPDSHATHSNGGTHRLQRMLNAIYHLKLGNILLLFIVATILLYLMDWYVRSNLLPAQVVGLREIPWQSLAGSCLSVVLIGFAYEYAVRRETGEKFDETLQQQFRVQNEAMSNLIPQAMLTDPVVMRRVFTAGVVDDAIRTGLQIRLGDDQLATEAYDSLLSQLLLSTERRSNYQCRASLTTIKDKDVTDDIRQKYYDGYIHERYTTILSKNSFRFCCVSTPQGYYELLRDSSLELRWLVELTRDFPQLDETIFKLESILVEEQPLTWTSAIIDEKLYITAEHPSLQTMIGEPVTVEYRYKVKIQKRGHLFRINIPVPTKGVAVELDYTDTDIRFVNVVDFLVSKTNSNIRYMPSPRDPHRVEVGVNEWVFPKSGVVFGWVLRSEMTPEFLKLMSEDPRSPKRTPTREGRTRPLQGT